LAESDLVQLNNPIRLSIGHRLRFLTRDSLVYGGAFASNAALSLITFPLLTQHFSVADYGLVDFFTVAAGLLAIAFVFWQDSAVARFFYEYRDVKRRRQIVSQPFVLILNPAAIVHEGCS
jgi:O-antigen/teichoic acid export membrane protein